MGGLATDITSGSPSTAEEMRPKRTYRSTRPLPTQLLDHCSVCLEEQLLPQALGLLSSALTSGNGTYAAACVPPIQHLGLISTLLVHPSMTSRTTSKDKHTAANESLRYLRQLHSVAGLESSGLSNLLYFGESGSSRSRRTRVRQSDVASDTEDDKHDALRSIYANKESLFRNVEDFWAMLGWALNCSVAHKPRWERWKLWLDFLLDVMETDLTKQGEAAKSAAPQEAHNLIAATLIARYLAPFTGQTRNNKRRLMRAILANGTSNHLNQFPEIWRNETRAPMVKAEPQTGRKRKLDIEHDMYGDYFDSESDTNSPGANGRFSRSSTRHASARPSRAGVEDDSPEVSPPPRSIDKKGSTPKPSSISNSVDSYGGIESIHVRQRLLALLARFCSLHPDFFLDTEDLFDLFTEFLRPLPLPVFSALVLPSQRYLETHLQASLDQMLLRPLLAHSAPVYNENSLTQEDFETHFAPFAANSTAVVENARVALLVEDLMRLLWTEGDWRGTKSLREAVETGIEARKAKAEWDGRRKTEAKAREEEEAMLVLEASAERMMCLLDMIR